MKKFVRPVVYGVVLWLTVFIVSVAIYPLHEEQRPLFESIMPVAITVCTTGLALDCLRRRTSGYTVAGAWLGGLWLATNVLIDMPLFLFGGPMAMTWSDYVMDIGVTYLIIPIVTIGIGVALERRPG